MKEFSRLAVNFARRMKRRFLSGLRELFVKISQRNVVFMGQNMIGKDVDIHSDRGSSIHVGRGTAFSDRARIHVTGAKIVFGKNVFVGIGTIIASRAGISIGDDCQIAEYVTIRDMDHDFEMAGPVGKSVFKTSKIIIEENVWIGAHVVVTRGVRLGRNSVIVAGSVVTRDVPPNAVYAGAPARLLRHFDKKQ